MSNQDFQTQLEKAFSRNGFANLSLRKNGVSLKGFTLLPAEGGVIIQGGANKVTVEKAAETFIAIAEKNNCELVFA